MKYGLQLRVQPQQKKQPPLAGFNSDDDDYNVERDILRQAHKNKTHKYVEELHKKTLEDDPSAFDYDGVYDKIKVRQDRQDREPRYIHGLKDKAKQREQEHEEKNERKLAKERSKDKHLYPDKDEFLTSAYKEELAEKAKREEEKRIREMREEKDDVTKKTDISDFYFNLGKNVAFGATEADGRKPEKHPVQASHASTSESSKILEKSNQYDDADNDDDDDDKYHSPDEKSNHPSSSPVSEPFRTDDQKKNDKVVAKNHHKRSEDAVAAAKERFLARKKAKV